jgi:sensor histidine kinase YesM
MKYKKVSISMRSKILILCTASTLLALILQAVLFQKTSSVLIYNQGKEASLNSLQNMQDDIYTFIKSIESSIIEVYNQKELIRDLAGGMDNHTLKTKHNRVAYDMALSVFESSQNINAIYIYDMKDNLISSYRHAATPMYTYPDDIYINEKESNADIVRKYVASDNKVMLVSSYYNKNRKKDIIRFVLKIYTNNATRKIGYIICDIDEKSFLQRVEKYAYSNEQIVWLQPIGDRPLLQVGELSGNKKDYYLNATSLVATNTWPMENTIITSGSVFFEVPQKKYNLAAFSLTPQFLLEQSERVLTRNLFIIAILIIIVFSIVSILISRSLTTPLENMVDTMVKIKEGNTSLRLSDLRDDEIGKLGGAFNEMLDQIENLIMREYQSKLLLNHAEYKALQAQVNPHFLYNTLETMSSIALQQQCSIVSSLCIALSNIFRYSIDMKNPLSTIEKEIIHIKNYMYVMNVRLNDGIDFEININSSLLNESIPILSIQPLVENSIRHGLKDKHGDKKIRIEAEGSEENIEISVIDNGIGMEADEINSQLQAPELEVLEKGYSIGLCNISARVKLLFGKDYGVKVYSIIGEGSKVTLCIPRMKKGGDTV